MDSRLYRPDGKVGRMNRETRGRILEAGLELVAAGRPVTLESTAQRAGLTKPGLMYHFATKQELMLGLVDRVIDRWQQRLSRHLGGPPEVATAAERIRVYVDSALSEEVDGTDVVMFSDIRFRELMTSRWMQRMEQWVGVPEGIDATVEGRLLTARLIADGAWYATAFGLFPLDRAAAERVRDTAAALLEGP